MEDKENEVKEEVVKEEAKKKHTKTIKGKGLTAFIIIIVVIALALCYGCGFILGKQLYEKENEEPEQKETGSDNNTDKEPDTGNQTDTDKIHGLANGDIDTNNDAIQEYFNIYKYQNIGDDTLLENVASGNETSKASLASRLVKEKEFVEVSCNQINENTVEREDSYCGEVYLKSQWKNSTAVTKGIKKEVVNNYYKSLFGKNTEINSTTLNPKTIEPTSYIYDENLDTYVKISYEGGGTEPEYTETLKSATKTDDTLTLVSTLTSEEIGVNKEVTLTLRWEESTNHYIFESRTTN